MQIDYQDHTVRERIMETAIRRASKWMSLNEQDAKPMIGQVGGVSAHKRPLLTLKPDYVLKPVQTDHRGIREIAFYEAIRTVLHNPSNHTYATFLTGKQRAKNAVMHCGELVDTVALALAIFLKDSVVAESEANLKEAWKTVKREVDALNRLAKFTAPYYGVLGQRSVSAASNIPFGVTEDAHLLLQDLTVNYSQPCVMDLKIGAQSYEPDATEEKRIKEYSKYPEQAQFGFRIVGMRVYDRSNPDVDANGYCFIRKSYGRSLKTRESIKDALRIYLSAGIQKKPTNGDIKQGEEPTVLEERIRTKAISNLLVQLRQLRRWFDENKSLRFYASSLLIVYEGDTLKDRDVVSIRMIDFGRVRRESGGDQGYIHGLRMLRNFLQDILDEEEERLGIHRYSSEQG
jgi:Inositol polyphosphate kinase